MYRSLNAPSAEATMADVPKASEKSASYMKKLVISVIDDPYVHCTAEMKVILICQSSDDTLVSATG